MYGEQIIYLFLKKLLMYWEQNLVVTCISVMNVMKRVKQFWIFSILFVWHWTVWCIINSCEFIPDIVSFLSAFTTVLTLFESMIISVWLSWQQRSIFLRIIQERCQLGLKSFGFRFKCHSLLYMNRVMKRENNSTLNIIENQRMLLVRKNRQLDFCDEHPK